MTEEERKEIDPNLCAEGLHRILKNKSYLFSWKETAILYGAISLLYDCHYEEWLNKPTEEYDSWNPGEDI